MRKSHKRLLSAATVVGLMWASGPAIGQQKSLKTSFVGAWSLLHASRQCASRR